MDRTVLVEVIYDGELRSLSFLEAYQRRRHCAGDPNRTAQLAVYPHCLACDAQRNIVARHSRQRRGDAGRSEEHTSELQSLMRNSYAVFCLKKKKRHKKSITRTSMTNRTSIYTTYQTVIENKRTRSNNKSRKLDTDITR